MIDSIREKIEYMKVGYSNGVNTSLELFDVLSAIVDVISVKNEYVNKLITLRKLIKNSNISSSIFNKDLILVDNLILDILEKNDIDGNRLEDINKIYNKYKTKK